jgi:Rha family phage regulatory protein
MTDINTTVPCHLRTVRSLAQPIVFEKNGAVFARSEDVAAYFGKQHYIVLRDIKALISNDKLCAYNFVFTSKDVAGPNGGTRQSTTCNMSRDGFTLLAMGFTGKRALGWKLKYIETFNRMEAEIAARAWPTPEPVFDDEPAPRKPIGRKAIDQMDTGMDLILTAETALRADGWLDAKTIEAIRNTISQGLKHLSPARAALNGH